MFKLHITKVLFLLGISLTMLSIACSNQINLPENSIKIIDNNDSIYLIPFSGNSFISNASADQTAEITRNTGLKDWTNNKTIISTYFRVPKAGKLKIALRAKGSSQNNSKIKLTINEQSKEITVKGDLTKDYQVGIFDVNSGYVKVDIQGIEKSGDYFADVSDLVVSGALAKEGLLYSNDESFYYWARRGPSCHMAFTIPSNENISYYYSELQVPEGQDKIGSYFMANGFAEGYFGIQVNSETERRVLFSVWSPFQTDDPSSIPDDQKIILNKKGDKVNTGEFGNEGSGGQSFLRFNWKAGHKYKFLLKGEPDNKGNTDYTAWFFAPEEDKWTLIASFKRPQTNTYLKRFHSFLENFNPNNGHLGREANYLNQWVRSSSNKWYKIQKGKFTVDATYSNKQRNDAIGGTNDLGFFLRNGGFFSDEVTPGSEFNFENKSSEPEIDFSNLP